MMVYLEMLSYLNGYEYGYSGYGIGFDVHSHFFIKFGKFFVFDADNSLSARTDKRKKVY